MSQNCKATLTAATTRDANNNTLYHGAVNQSFSDRRYSPPSVAAAGNYQQMSAKVLFSGVATINDLKLDKTERETRRAH